jgi:hypothetical protein
MGERRNITIHNVMKEMVLDCDGMTTNDLEIQYLDVKEQIIKKVRSNYISIKMNRKEPRDIELEWE